MTVKKTVLDQSNNSVAITEAIRVLKDNPGGENTILTTAKEASSQLIEMAHRSYGSAVEGYPEYAEAECVHVHEQVKLGLPNYVEIRLDQKQHYSVQSRSALGATCIRLRFGGDRGELLTVFLPKESSLPVRIFLNGEKKLGLLALLEENGEEFIVPLEFCHLFSINEHSRPERELAVVTSFLSCGSLHSSPILARDLNVIKQILLADWLKSVEKSKLLKASEKQEPNPKGEGSDEQ